MMMQGKNKLDVCGGMVSSAGGCDHMRGEHPDDGPCVYLEATGPGPDEQEQCGCKGFVEKPEPEQSPAPEEVPPPEV